VTENDCVFNAREPILHLMRSERNAADELVRVKLRADHGSPSAANWAATSTTS
jgi:hypothetical protein